MDLFRNEFKKFFSLEIDETTINKKILELNIDSLSFWEFIGLLEEKYEIEFDMLELSTSIDSIGGLEKLFMQKVRKDG
ncbi:MAG TPA: phosphopantetheine-binding protein [Petrotogaceae bacterium]|mgnify:FL=1|jgi:acyl carrier protein|nr:phosphopantetheine-binding protein [Petrotogaceae bacterium]